MYFDGIDDNISTTAGWPELADSDEGYTVSFWYKADFPTVNAAHFLQISELVSTFQHNRPPHRQFDFWQGG